MKKREWKTIRDGDRDGGKEKKGREIEGKEEDGVDGRDGKEGRLWKVWLG